MFLVSPQALARGFLDEEAEVSGEDADGVSSDEGDDSENEKDSSLLDFVNDRTQLSQAINGKCCHDTRQFDCVYFHLY